MPFDVLLCPQCGATLPRQARWRMVPCPGCGVQVTRREDVVEARRIRETAAAVRAAVPEPVELVLQGVPYRRLRLLAQSTRAEVLEGMRNEPFGEGVVLKLARPGSAAGAFAREAEVLRALQRSEARGFAHFTQRLPQVVAHGLASGPSGQDRDALALRRIPGVWGSLAAVAARHPGGLDPRHAVWMWRRVLEVLAFVHESGWRHGDLAPEHLLVQPGDHGVLITGWSRAREDGDKASRVRDLRQAAWSIRSLLRGDGDPVDLPASVPRSLAALLDRAAADACPASARALDGELQAAAREAFGPPRFIPFTP
jgi:predicted RNA-binding Zn-ribbon protein involved in translation (DUF1610 family)